MSFDEKVNLDIPPYWDNIVNYRASLGHKVTMIAYPYQQIKYGKVGPWIH